jgi:hypothetical protein
MSDAGGVGEPTTRLSRSPTSESRPIGGAGGFSLWKQEREWCLLARSLWFVSGRLGAAELEKAPDRVSVRAGLARSSRETRGRPVYGRTPTQ